MSVDKYIEKHLNQKVLSSKSIGTGLFSAYKVKLENGESVFIKYQSQANNELINEGRELQLLGKTVHTPKVLGSCEHSLILEWVESTNNPNTQLQLGVQLGKLHQQKSKYFGFEFDNKIGQTPQYNAVGKNITNWTDFYWQYRLLFQIELARKNGYLNNQDFSDLLKIESTMPKLFNNNIKPVLLHGDLWSGNFISGKKHHYFIDTASYYGHSEADLALTFMFGGFSNEFYSGYKSIITLEEGFDKRKPLYMLYHYLNHLNLFGNGYYSGVMNCVRQIN